jgi:hypothetical protein
VKPIEVSIDLPCSMAVIEAPAGAVEPVAPDTVLLVELVGQAVMVGGRGHGLVERGVEHRHLLHAGQHRLRFPDAREVGRVVQRREIGALFDGFHDRIVDDYRGGVALAAVHYPVADAGDFREIGENTPVRVGQGLAHELHGHLVVRHLHRARVVAARGLLHDASLQFADALNDAFPEAGALRHLPDLVLQG